MANKTKIEWVLNHDGSQGHTVNPIRFRNLETGKIGHHCEKISAGCKNCYASTMQKPYLSGLEFVAENRGDGEFFLDKATLRAVLRRRTPTTYFWGDMTDLFGSWVPDEWLDWCFGVAAVTPQHRHIFLTKRAARLPEYFGATRFSMDGLAFEELVNHCEFWDWVTEVLPATGYGLMQRIDAAWRWPLPNVILGVSCEGQAAADERIPHLLATPAACRMVSCEPLLGEIDLGCVPWPEGWQGPDDISDGIDPLRFDIAHLDWVIVGGESGPGARPMHPDWARSLRDQCVDAGVPFFFKQWGEWLPGTQYEQVHHDADPEDDSRFLCMDWDGEEYFHSPGQWMDEIDDAAVFRVGKKLAGRLLDGRAWDERPEVLR